MMKTRRKAKAAAASEGVDQRSSPIHDDSHFTLTIPDDINEDVLAKLLPDFNTLSPSPDDIVTLYRILLAQASDLDDAHQKLDEAVGEVQRKEVELDQALQDKENYAHEVETSMESLREEVDRFKQERDHLAEAKAALESQVASLSDLKSSSSSEADTLKHQLENTEREKRDLVGVISRLKQESVQREEEIQNLRTNLKEARQEHQAFESQVRDLRSTETSTKFKIDSLSQQLQLFQTEVERTNAELSSKTEEYAKYRRTKHTEMATLQASYDSLVQSHASTQASLKALQSAHTGQSHQLAQALAKVQDLTGQLAEQEATYSSEASGLKRLVTMMEEREKQAREIVEAIEREWASVGEKSERRESLLREEIERERKGRETAEKRAEQLETVMERMGRGELPIPGTPTRTPMRDPMIDGMMGLSPTVAMASKAQRSGKTFTEVYADYVRLQEDYAKKSAEYDHMDRTLAAVLTQIEERAPILSQQRIEYERLQSEASQLASQLAQALAERDNQANNAQESSQKLNKSIAENDLLQKQLEDLGRQVRSLLREIARRDDPTIPPDEDLENTQAVVEDTETLISNNLVLFKSIDGLQEQNQRLLKIVREMGRKMEAEEKEYKDAMEREQAEAVREAHEAMQELAAQLERQKKSSDSVIQAYVKERDALRGMLSRAEKAAGRSFSNGVNVDSPMDGTAPAVDSDLAKELAEVQSQFDAYRMEMGFDSGRLREDLVAAQREVSSLEASLAKANAKIEYLSERHRMHQDQFAMHGREINELTKRNQQLFDQWTRIDIECGRVTEELQVSNGRLEQLRNECANLRAEKKIWEGVQSRLVEENRSLALERSHLSDLMSNVQKMHNDLERSGENDRRRLESQLQMLEGQNQDLRAQVVQERDSVRHLSLQKDFELKELHTRLDKSTQEFSKTRESLVSAETSKKHLEQLVEELSRQLKGNEEKLAVYERRTTTATSSIGQNIDQDLSREQQLEAEVADLRSALTIAEVDLATARNNVEQYRGISQASEEALADIQSTFDMHKASAEAEIARHESELKALQEKLQSTQEQLNQTQAMYTKLQETYETDRSTWANDKKVLEDTIVDMSTSERHSESDRSSREQEVRQIEDRAKAAEERYTHEVVAHAESIKTIDDLKRKLAEAQASARDYLTAAETSEAKLSSSESSWKQQKEALDKEVADLNARCKDLSSQNAILHQHLESVSSQAARIRQVADSSSESAGEAAGDDTDTKLSELRTVVSYLRKEKEIVDLQLELSKQENARLKAQIDHLSQTLQETRATLSEEREKAVESAASEAQHAELVERINQLNILRESNATLRADCESYSRKCRELEIKLKQMSEQLEPTKESARMAQAELEATKGQLQRFEQESRSWQERNAQLLSKYDRVDPMEIQSMKDEIERLKTQLSEAEAARDSKSADVDTQLKKAENLEALLAKHREQAAKNLGVFKTRMAELKTLQDDKKEMEDKIAALETENGTLQAAKATSAVSENAASADAAQQLATIESLREERDRLLAEKETWSKAAETTAEGASAPAAWETEKAGLLKARDEATEKLKAATEQVQKAVDEAKNIRAQNEKYMARIRSLTETRAQDAERATAQQAAAVAEAVEKTKNELQNTSAPSPPQEDLVKKHAEEIRVLQEQLTAKHQQELKAAVEAALKDRPEPADAEKKDEAKHAEDIAAAVDRGRMELTSKLKVKDSQLVKAQNRVKSLEAQILEWREKGLLPGPEASAPSPVTPAGPSATTAPVAGGSGEQAPPPGRTIGNAALAKATAAATGSAALPRKPNPLGSARGGPPGRGGVAGRGVAPRGGAPARVAPSKPSAAAATNANATAGASGPSTGASGGASAPGEMSIMGAAAAVKRPREDGGQAAEDSLAKRLKPADGGTGKAPVLLRRPPPTT